METQDNSTTPKSKYSRIVLEPAINLDDDESREPFLSDYRYFGFKTPPFGFRLDVNNFIPVPSRFSLLVLILRKHEKSFIRWLIIGKAGTGKTSMAKVLTALLEGEGHVLVMNLFMPNSSRLEDVLRTIFGQLQLEWQKNVEQSLQFLKDKFIHQAEIGKPYFMLVDNDLTDLPAYADTILSELLQLRYADQPVCHLVWFDVEVPDKKKYRFIEFMEKQKAIQDLTFREMNTLIQHRCEKAGRKDVPFTRDAILRIFYYTNGNPKLTVRLCDSVMDETVGQKKAICDVEDVDNAHKWIYGNQANL